MEPGFSRTVYMEMMSKWALIWGWGAIIMLGRVGWAFCMPYGWKWQLPMSIVVGSLLGIPLWRVWRKFKLLLVVWAEDDARQVKARAEREKLDRREKELELLEREKKVRLEEIRQQRERKRQIAELNAMSDELEGELDGQV